MMWIFVLYFVLFAGIAFYVTMNSRKFIGINLSLEMSILASAVFGALFGAIFSSFHRKEGYDTNTKMIGYDDVDYVHAYANTIVDRAVKSVKIPNQEVNINPAPCDLQGRTWLSDDLEVRSVDPAVVDVERAIIKKHSTHVQTMENLQREHESKMMNLQREHEAKIVAMKDPNMIRREQDAHNAKMNELQNAHVDMMMKKQQTHDREIVEMEKKPVVKESFELPGEIRENREFDSGCQKCGVPMPYTTWQDFWKAGCM
jgi:hypothetical protein